MRRLCPRTSRSNRAQSTLSQIQKKGINRGGLYGFFVRGESIAGTLGDSEDSSTVPTDVSAAPSGISTPATSASDSEPTKKSSDKKEKRKREAHKEESKSKKSKSKKEGSEDKEAKKLAKKIAKLSVEEKASYEKRAAAKGQTLEAYVARRIQKKNDQRSIR